MRGSLAQLTASIAGSRMTRAPLRRRVDRQPLGTGRCAVRRAARRNLRRPRLPRPGGGQERGCGGGGQAAENFPLPALVVPDSLAALGRIGHAWRSQFAMPLIAVTGSNGKTTVTQMIASILRAAYGDDARCDRGQPQQPHRRAADGAASARRAPRRGGRAGHEPSRRDRASRRASPRPPSRWSTTRSASTRNSWAPSRRWRARTARCSQALPADGVAVFPGDDEYAALWRTRLRQAPCCVRAERCLRRARDVTPNGFGRRARHHAAGSAVQHQARRRRPPQRAQRARAPAPARSPPASRSTPSCAGWKPFAPVKRPLAAQARAAVGARSVIDDTYNANPDSCAPPSTCSPVGRAAHAWCWATWARSATRDRRSTKRSAPTRKPRHRDRAGRRRLTRAHDERGRAALRSSSTIYWQHWPATGQRTAAAVLVKGSRFMGMERVVAALGRTQQHWKDAD